MQRCRRFYIVGLFGLVVFLIAVFVLGFFICFPLKYEEKIIFYSKKSGIDSGLVASLIYAESRFNKNSKSIKGAIGLMQIMPATAKAFSDDYFYEELLYNADENIKIGTRFLRYLFDKYDDEVVVLACYNAGESVVRLWMGDDGVLTREEINYIETRLYVDKVLKFKKFYALRLKNK